VDSRRGEGLGRERGVGEAIVLTEAFEVERGRGPSRRSPEELFRLRLSNPLKLAIDFGLPPPPPASCPNSSVLVRGLDKRLLLERLRLRV